MKKFTYLYYVHAYYKSLNLPCKIYVTKFFKNGKIALYKGFADIRYSIYDKDKFFKTFEVLGIYDDKQKKVDINLFN